MRQRVAELERARDDALREQDRVGGDATAVTAELSAAKREIDDLNREKHDLGNQKGIDYGGRTAATDELNAKAAAAQGGGDNKALAMFGGGKKKSPFG